MDSITIKIPSFIRELVKHYHITGPGLVAYTCYHLELHRPQWKPAIEQVRHGAMFLMTLGIPFTAKKALISFLVTDAGRGFVREILKTIPLSDLSSQSQVGSLRPNASNQPSEMAAQPKE